MVHSVKNTVTIRIPPLRDRIDDIIPIFKKFVLEFSRQYDSVFQGFADEARHLLLSYRWPGNIRELRNVAEQLVVLEKSQFITPEILQKYLKGRQYHGSTDNLPILYGGSGNQYDNSHNGARNEVDSDLIYRSMIEMRTEIAELKKMMGSLIYAQFSSGAIEKKLLPDTGTYGNPNYYRETETPDSNLRGSGIHVNAADYDDNDLAEDAELFGHDELPSLEEAEKMLIARALVIFKGNRRKASEALGVSERTLYRKIDQYQL